MGKLSPLSIGRKLRMKKKVLLLLAGQLRTFDDPIVKKSWDKFFDLYDVTTVGAFWTNRGFSSYKGDASRANETLTSEQAKDVFKTDHVSMFDYPRFIEELPERFKGYQGLEYFTASVSQSYMRYQAALGYLRIQKHLDIDAAIVTRPDLIFLREPPTLPFEETGFVWHQNSSQNHYPARIYDVFLFSSLQNIIMVSKMYEDPVFIDCIEKKLHNRLTKMDICRIYHNYFEKRGLQEKSYDLLYADIFRWEEDLGNYRKQYLNNERLWCEL